MFNEKVLHEVEVKHYDVMRRGLEDRDGIILITSLVGSQNYGLETETSDIDTCSIVLPSYLSFIRGDAPISYEVEYADGSHAVVRDLRLALNSLRKSTPNSVEWFLSDYKIYNPDFENIFKDYFNNDTLFYLIHASFQHMVNAVCGTAKQLHGRNMTAGKKVAHCYRLKTLLQRYLNTEYREMEHYLRISDLSLPIAHAAKLNGDNEPVESLEKAQVFFDIMKQTFILEPENKAIEYLANYTINRFQYDLMKKYLELNGFKKE